MDFTITRIPKIISIEGNIGAGKTTFVQELKKRYENSREIIFLTEPVDIWEKIKDENNKTILERFYENPKEYSFSFQIMAYVTRLNLLTKTIVNNPMCKLIITERSLDADKNVFAKMLYDDKLIDNLNYNIYLEFYNTYKEKYKTSGIIFINADAEICYERVNKRNRTGEESVTLDYLTKCEKYHYSWLYTSKDLLNLNTNQDANYKNVNDPGLEWINKSTNYINNILNAEDTARWI